MMRRVVVFAGAALLLSCAPEQAGTSAGGPARPGPVALQPANAPPQYAAFAGRWSGFWDGSFPSVLVVERITPDGQLDLSYQFAQEVPVRIRSRIENNGFRWGTTNRFTFVLRPDGRLDGERVTPSGQLNTITLTRN